MATLMEQMVVRGMLGMAVSITDISERKRAEREIEESRDQLRLITDNLPALIAYVDADLRYRFANKTTTEWHARPVEEIIGKSVPELLGQEYEKLRPRIDRVFAGEQLTYIDSVTYPDGVTRTVRGTYVPHFGEAGSVEGCFSLVEDITELQQTEEALSESETRYRQLAELSPDGMFVHVGGEIVFANASLARILTFPSPEDLLGKQASDLLAPEYRARVLERRDKLMRGEVLELEQLEYLRSDGSRVFADNSGTLVSWDNTPAVLVLVRDISERVEAELALRERQAHLHAIADNSLAVTFLKDTDGRFIFANRVWHDLYNPTDEDIADKTAHDFLPPEIADAVVAADAKVLETGEPTVEELILPTAQGEPQNILFTKFPVFDDGGNIIALGGFNIDITERVKAEMVLREHQERLRLLLETTPAIPWEADAKSWIFTYVGPQAVELLGYPRERWLEKDFWVEHIHPEDRARVVDYCLTASNRDETYEFEYRMIAADGRNVWLHDIVNVVKEDGTPVALRGFMIDITERKRAEAALHKSQGRLIDAIESISEGFILYDAEERLVLCNSKYRDFYPKIADVLKPGVCLVDIVRAAAEKGQILQAIDDVDGWIRERLTQYRSASGSQEQQLSDGRWLEVSERRTREGGFVGIRTDVTERKSSEELQRNLSARLIGAYEDERRKISRELHDDFAQRLALLAFEIQRLGQKMSEPEFEGAESIDKLWSQTNELATDLHRLSRQLHPAMLDQLGLGPAIKSLCSEFSQQHGIQINITEHEIPATISPDIALCLYRTVQEGLRNIVKHSGVKDAEVELTGGPDAIHLRIVDQGVGFDPDTTKGKGLGLVSIDERVRLVRGEFSLQSQPSQGTSIDLRIPLAAPDA